MIKKISYCNTDMAQQLADLEKEIFGTAWNNELITQKISQHDDLGPGIQKKVKEIKLSE